MDTKFTAMTESTPSVPGKHTKRIIIAATAMALAMMLCGIMLMIAGNWSAGSVIVFLSLVALIYDIHVARCYRQRRRQAEAGPDNTQTSGTDDLPS